MTLEKELFEKYGVEGIEGEHKCNNEDYVCHKGICPENCTKCDYFEKYALIYPPITAEKVLRLEEIIIRKTFSYINMENRKIIENAPFGYCYKFGLYECHCGMSSTHKIGKGKTRVKSLCCLLSLLFDDLTPQERNEIKEILEG